MDENFTIKYGKKINNAPSSGTMSQKARDFPGDKDGRVCPSDEASIQTRSKVQEYASAKEAGREAYSTDDGKVPLGGGNGNGGRLEVVDVISARP